MPPRDQDEGYSPTCDLRIMKKDGWVETRTDTYYKPEKVLQQLWVSDYEGYEPVWRDVPEVPERV